MNAQTILGLIARHALTTLAGILVSRGYLQASGTDAFIGACMLILGVGWSWWQKTGQQELAAELARFKTAAPATPPVPPKAVIAFLVLSLGALLLSSAAHAQTGATKAALAARAQAVKKTAASVPCTDLLNLLPPGCTPPAGSPVGIKALTPQAIAEKIQKLALSDFVYADALAQATGNTVTEPCWHAWVGLITKQQQPLLGPSITETVVWASGPQFNTMAPHNLMVGQAVVFTDPPSGIAAAMSYYVIQDGYTATTFEVAATVGGMAVIPTGPASGGISITSAPQILQRPDPDLVTSVEYVSEAVQLLQSNSPISLACAPMAQAVGKDFTTLAGQLLSGGALGLFKLPVVP